MTTSQERAANLLQFYMAKAWETAGLPWQGDNDAEVTAMVEHITEAARERLPALDRKCWQCDASAESGGGTCGICDGNGWLVTDEGRELIAFLQRHPAALTRVEG